MDSPNGLTIPPLTDLVSPELALVDPALAERARSWLPDPENTLVRVERLVRAHRIAASRARQVEALGIPPQASLEPSAPRAVRTGHRRSAMLAGGAAAGALVAALLVGVRVDVRGTPAGADTTAIGEPPASGIAPAAPATSTVPEKPAAPATSPVPAKPKRNETAPSRPLGSSRPTKPRTPRRFAWAPVDRASGYHVEFFRGAALVFSADTKRPELSIPSSWRLHGRPHTLEPGEYRWYVWPLISGRRASGAVVQAKLVVSPR